MNFTTSFYDATGQVLTNMMQLKIKQGTMLTKKNPLLMEEVNVSIGVTGDLKGNILFSLPKELTLKIVEQMSGMKIDQIDKFATSAIAELANIISGNAATKLSEEDYICDISPPQIISGSNNQITLSTKEILVLPIETDIGDFSINIALQER